MLLLCDIHDFDNNSFIPNGTIIDSDYFDANDFDALLRGEMVRNERFGDNVFICESENE